ncbi:properdin-like [Haliotis asinina]|uniref:properdin-like n=1 Tax=Haliotis asinina TaxID=109174 RepID=UPI0035318E78
MLRPYLTLLTVVLCVCSITAEDLIFFDSVLENIYEGRSDNFITLRRFNTDEGNITIIYTVSGIGITSPDDFIGGDFSIVYPPTADPLRVPINFIDNSECDASRTIVVRITGIDKAPVPDSDVKHYIVVDDDGEWMAWVTSEGPCNCETTTRDRFRTRTCDDKGIAGRTCDGPATMNETVSCAGDPTCPSTHTYLLNSTTTAMPTTSTTPAPVMPYLVISSPIVSECYGPWGCWKPGPCSVSCGQGSLVETRNRELLDCGNDACDEPLEQNRTAVCMEQNCMCAEALTRWSEWSASGSCSATCDGMLKESRNRICKKLSGCPGVPLDQTRIEMCSSAC